MSDTRLKVAIIGTGSVSRVHADAILTHRDSVECVALCDVSEANLRERNAQLGGGCALFGNWQELLSELGERLEAVIICLPHHLHSAAVLDCAAARKHILCEKPLCTNLRDADVLVRAVREAGVTFMPGHNQLFAPMIREVKRRLTEGAIGTPYWMRAQACFLNAADFSEAWRGRADLQGGGELIDTGYHGTYTLLYFAAAPVAAVRGTFGRFHHHIQGEDSASVQVLFENGVIGEVLTSWAFPNPHGTHDLHVIGSEGQLFGSGNVLYHLARGEGEPTRVELPQAPSFAALMAYQLAYFVECVRTGARPLHSVEDSREVLSVIVAATENASGWEPYAMLKPRQVAG